MECEAYEEVDLSEIKPHPNLRGDNRLFWLSVLQTYDRKKISFDQPFVLTHPWFPQLEVSAALPELPTTSKRWLLDQVIHLPESSLPWQYLCSEVKDRGPELEAVHVIRDTLSPLHLFSYDTTMRWFHWHKYMFQHWVDGEGFLIRRTQPNVSLTAALLPKPFP